MEHGWCFLEQMSLNDVCSWKMDDCGRMRRLFEKDHLRLGRPMRGHCKSPKWKIMAIVVVYLHMDDAMTVGWSRKPGEPRAVGLCGVVSSGMLQPVFPFSVILKYIEYISLWYIMIYRDDGDDDGESYLRISSLFFYYSPSDILQLSTIIITITAFAWASSPAAPPRLDPTRCKVQGLWSIASSPGSGPEASCATKKKVRGWWPTNFPSFWDDFPIFFRMNLLLLSQTCRGLWQGAPWILAILAVSHDHLRTSLPSLPISKSVMIAWHCSKVDDHWQHPTESMSSLVLCFQVISLIFGSLGTPAIHLTKPQMSLTNQTQQAHQQHSAEP